MKLNDFKKQLKKEEYKIPEVNEKVKQTEQFKNREYDNSGLFVKFLKRNKFRLTFGSIAIILIVILVTVLIKDGQQAIYGKTDINYVLNKNDLKEITSYQETDFFDFSGINILYFKKGEAAYDIAPSAIDNMESENIKNYNSKSTEIEVSKTNNQVNNVDEADLCKCDGDKIYRVYQNKLMISKINNGTISEVKEITLYEMQSANSYYYYYSTQTEMYLTDLYVVVLSTNYNQIHINIYTKDTLELKKTFESAYTYLDDSRIVEGEKDVLYLVYNQAINNYEEPSYTEDGNKVNYDYKNIAYFNCIRNQSYTYLVSIQLDENLKINSKVQLGVSSWNHIYVTENSIYFASVIYTYSYSYIRFNYDDTTTSTVIIKYDIHEGEINLVASLSSKGEVISQFAMNEYDGYFRVALSIINNNKVEIYKITEVEGVKNFVLVGAVNEGLGEKNEVIKSVNFNKNECLVVTAKNTDPMYKIDLSDPEKPVILGKFKEDGFNSYLQYLTGEYEGLAFGVGYLTEDISDDYNIRTNTKIGLYDVTGDNPVQLQLITFDATYMEACTNHKAIFVYNGYIGFDCLGVYHLYKIVKEKVEETETVKLEEVLKYDLNILEDLGYNDYNYGRMYYVDGYFYLTFENYDSNSNAQVHFISFDSEFESVDTKVVKIDFNYNK